MHFSIRRVLLLVGFALVCLLSRNLIAQYGGNPDAAKVKNPAPSTPESIAAGKEVFQRNCRTCHGENAKGGASIIENSPPAPDLTDSRWLYGSSDGEMFYVIKNGAAPDLFMESWDGRISETEMWNAINYIRSLAPNK